MSYFQVLYEALHFGRAAELAGVSQPALSAQIAEMEERLGCRLFERGGRTVRPTEEARMMKPRIDHILTEVADVEGLARRGRSAFTGRFRLGIIPTIAPYLLPSALPVIRRRFPQLDLEIRESVTGTLVEETLAGRLDAFLAAEPLDQPQLSGQRIVTDRFFLAVPADDPAFAEPPVPPESPELERLMLLEEGHCMREQALAVCGAIKPSTMARYGATSLTTLLQMVAHGLGVTLVPEMAVRAGALPAADLKVVPFREPMPARTITLAWRRNSPRGAECRMLATLLAELSGGGDVDGEPDPEHAEHDEAQREGRLAVADPVGSHVDEGVKVTR